MSFKDQNQHLQQIDLLIREGQGRLAAQELLKLNASSLDRPHLATAANLFRRVGMNTQGLKILNPIVRPSSKNFTAPTQAELTEYGALLINLGVFHEGLSILNSVDSKQTPSALLFKAFGLFNQWDYEQALPFLEAYIQNPSLNEYQRQIGALNLMATYAETWNFKLFDEGFKNLADYLLKNDYKLLLGNLFEIKAQRDFFDGNLKEAKKSLNTSAFFLTEAEAITLFLIKKWNYIFNLTTQNANDENAYFELRSEAIREGFAEGVRDLDLYRFAKAKNQRGIEYLYWGTPFSAYRKKIQRFNKQSSLTSDSFLWSPSQNNFLFSKKQPEQLDGPSKLLQIINPIEDRSLQDNPLLMKLFFILTQDFYRELKAPEIYSLIFPENFYNPYSSPEVIKQLVFRLRKVMIQNKWPIELCVNRNAYSLQFKKLRKNQFAIELSFINRTSSEIDKQLTIQKLRLYRLRDHAAKEYSYGELRRNSLQCDSVLNSELKKALQLGLVSKHGKGTNKLNRTKPTAQVTKLNHHSKAVK